MKKHDIAIFIILITVVVLLLFLLACWTIKPTKSRPAMSTRQSVEAVMEGWATRCGRWWRSIRGKQGAEQQAVV
jgi:hypothetical protein